MWEAGFMEPGMYILDGAAMKAFLEPRLRVRDGTHSVMGRAILVLSKTLLRDKPNTRDWFSS